MPFEKAKTIISKEIKEKKAVLETDAKAYYSTLKGKLARTEEDFSHYVKKLDYPGNKKDVDAYHAMVKTQMKEMLKDNKATAEEMSGFYKLMFGKSERLKSKLIEGERKHEENKFKKVKAKVEKDVEGAKFKEAKEKLSAMLASLNPLNRTDTTSGRARYNLKENFLRVDMRILEQRTAILEAEIAYDTVFKEADSTMQGGNYFEGMPPPNYIIAKKDGQITLGAPSIDPQSGKITVSNTRELNWLTLSEDIGRNHYGAKRLRITRDEAGKFIFEGTDFTEAKDDERRDEILKNRAQLAEIRILKQINAIYTMKGMESLPEDQKERMRKALKENLNSMRLYFFEFNGQVLTTEEFENSDPIKKQAIFKKMLSGVGRILKRMELEDTIKKLKEKENLTPLEKGKLKFAKGELAIREGRFIDAYSQFRGFLGMDGQPHEMEVKASKYIHMASLGIIDIANRYIAASVGEVPETVINQALDQTGRIRRILEKNEWMNLEDAMTKADSSWRKTARTGKSGHYLSRGVERQGGGTSQLFPTSSMGSSRVILTLRGHILKRLALVATVIDDKDRQKALLNQAQYARKSKHYAAAGVLLKEAMRGEMNRHRRELQRDPEYWKKVKEYRQFSYFERLNVVAKVAPRMAKKMIGAKKYARLPQAEKDKLISRLTQMILQKRVKAREQEYVFKSYLKRYKGTRSMAADSFIDMKNPFDDLRPWKWSDKAWDGIKKRVLIDGVMIAVSGGMAGAGREAAVVGGRALIGRYLGARIAASLPARVLTSLIGFGVEVLTFETAMRIQQRGINEKTFEGFWEGAWHSARTLGIMNIGGKFVSRALGMLRPFSHVPAEELGKFRKAIQIAVPRTVSAVGFEAPLMTYLSMKFDDVQGMNALQIYANALKDIAAISIGHAVVNSASGNLFPRAMQNMAKRRRIMDLLGGRKVSVQVRRALESIRETGVAMKEFITNPEKFLRLGEYVAAQSDGLLVLKVADPAKLTPENRRIFENFKRGVVEKLQSFGISRQQAVKLFDRLNPRRLSQISQSLPVTRKLGKAVVHADNTPTRVEGKRKKVIIGKKETPVSTVEQSKLDRLASRLQAIGLRDLAYVIGERNIDRMPHTGKEIITYEQRQREVERLIVLDKGIKREADYLRAKGLKEIAKEFENYENTSKYKTLEERIKAIQELTASVKKLLENGIPFTGRNVREVIELLKGTSENGRKLRDKMVQRIIAELKKDGILQRSLDAEIDGILSGLFKGASSKVRERVRGLIEQKLMKPEDKIIIEANRKIMTPELLKAIIAGGENFTEGGVTVRIYKGMELGKGGLGTVNEVWFVKKPSNKLRHGVVKIPHEETKPYFGYEANAAKRLSRVLNKDKSTSSKHLIKPIFASEEIIIYEKVTGRKGKTEDLHSAMVTMQTRDWLLQFVGGIRGLEYLARNGISHNDFKPGNIVIGKNGGVLIDIGSFIDKKDIGKTIRTTRNPANGKERIPIIILGNNMSIELPTTLALHDRTLIAHSIDKGKPLNLGDKYAVGTSLLYMLVKKGYATRESVSHAVVLKAEVPSGIRKLYELANKLLRCKLHPYEYKDNKRRKGKDPEYVSFKDVITQIQQIASTLPLDKTKATPRVSQTDTTVPPK